jgi:hypothetical protein
LLALVRFGMGGGERSCNRFQFAPYLHDILMIFRTNFRDLQADAGLAVDQSLPGKLLDGLAQASAHVPRSRSAVFR